MNARADQPRPDLGTLRVLAGMRIALAALLLALYGWMNSSEIYDPVDNLGSLPEAFWFPISLARLLPGPPSVFFAQTIGAAFVLCCLALLIGLFTRLSGALTYVTGLVYFTLALSFGKIGHHSHAMLLFLLVLCYSDWGHTLSVDSLWRRRQGRRDRGNPTDTPDWPIWTCAFTLGLIYTLSGAHKYAKGHFLNGGFEEYLKFRLVITEAREVFSAPWQQDALRYVLDRPALVSFGAWGALLFEAGFFVALLTKKLRLFMCAGVVVFHGCIGLLSSVYFTTPMQAAALIGVPTAVLLMRDRLGLFRTALPTSPDPEPRRRARWAQPWITTTAFIALPLTAVLLVAPLFPDGPTAPRLQTIARFFDIPAQWVFANERFLPLTVVGAIASAGVLGWMAMDLTRILRGRVGAREDRATLLYDQDCGFCQKWCDWAKARGAGPRVEFAPCQTANELRERAGIDDASCGDAAFLVSERGGLLEVSRGAGAINGVLARLPGGRNLAWRLLSSLYDVAGLRQIQDLGYRLVARNRARLSAGACAVAAPESEE